MVPHLCPRRGQLGGRSALVRGATLGHDGATINRDNPIRSLEWSEPISVGGQMTLRAVAKVLARYEVGAAVVRRDDGPGFISERDLVAALAAGGDPDDLWSGDVMTANLVTVSPGARSSTAPAACSRPASATSSWSTATTSLASSRCEPCWPSWPRRHRPDPTFAGARKPSAQAAWLGFPPSDPGPVSPGHHRVPVTARNALTRARAKRGAV